MKKTTIIISTTLAVLLLNTVDVEAQKSSKKFSIGFGLEAGAITGDFKDIYGGAAGITLRGSYKVGPGWGTLTTGAIACLPKDFQGDDLKAGVLVPFKLGYKYLLNKHIFAMAELGMSKFNYYYELNNQVEHTSQSGFVYSPCIGFQAKAFELSVRYESTSLAGAALSGAFLRLGFNF